MAKGNTIAPDIKELIIEKVKQGIPIPQLATEYNMSSKTIYAWLRTEGGSNNAGTGTTNKSKSNDALTIARLLKEKKELTEIIGKFCIQLEQLQTAESKKKLHFRAS